MSNKIKYRTEGLKGINGLILAVIAVSEADVIEGNGHARETIEYFRSDTYQMHMELLGLPSGLLPERLRGLV